MEDIEAPNTVPYQVNTSLPLWFISNIVSYVLTICLLHASSCLPWVWLSFCASFCSHVCLLVNLSVYLFNFLNTSFYPSFCSHVCLPSFCSRGCLLVSLSVFVFAFLNTRLFVSLSTHTWVFLPIYLSAICSSVGVSNILISMTVCLLFSLSF